jgi:hypothetical protein
MCDPVSIGLTVASAAVTMAGQYTQGQAAYSQAKYDEAGAKANEALAHDQAAASRGLTQQEAARRYRDESQLEGDQQAAMAANGIDIGFGSAAQTFRDDKMIAEEDLSNISKSGEQRTMGYLYDAYNYRLKAQAARSAASGAKTATGLGMLGTALGAASQLNKMGAAFGSASAPNFGGY